MSPLCRMLLGALLAVVCGRPSAASETDEAAAPQGRFQAPLLAREAGDELLVRQEPIEGATVGTAAPERPPAYVRFGDFDVGYDGGFLIRPRDSERFPYELRMNARLQFRHTFYDGPTEKIRLLNGRTAEVQERNDFEIERGRLEFGGFAYDPRLQYFVNVDFDTDDNHVLALQDAWFNYEFSEAFVLFAGKSFVPGSRHWLNGGFSSRFADRDMATTFFRPDRSVGVWAIGEVAENLRYRAMVANGFNAADLRSDQLDQDLVYSASLWYEPLGDFGRGWSDVESHEDAVARIGNSFTFGASSGDSRGVPIQERNFLRLSDGSRPTEGELAPGLTINSFDRFLYAVDLGWKYRGWSVDGEYYFRWIQDVEGNRPVPRRLQRFFDSGFVAQGGCFVLPRTLELIARVSTVQGDLDDSWEYAAGFNWFLRGHANRFTFDVTKLAGNIPAENSGPGYQIGMDGVMIRTQWQIAF